MLGDGILGKLNMGDNYSNYIHLYGNELDWCPECDQSLIEEKEEEYKE